MAQIYNSEVIKNIVDGCKIQISADRTPTQLAEKVVPVFVANKLLPKTKIYDDNTLNTNDKNVEIPKGKMWKVKTIEISYTSDANAGNRIITLAIRKDTAGGRSLYYMGAGSVQAQGLTRYYTFLPNAVRETTFVASRVIVPLPDIFIPGGYFIRISDEANISALDDFTFILTYEEYDISDISAN